MKKILPARSILVFAFAVFSILNLFTSHIHAQWIPLTALNGEPAYKVRATGSKVFAMNFNGVLQSPSGGNNWSIIQPLYLTNFVENIHTSGDTIVAFASPDSYLSTDNGSTWLTLTNAPSFVAASNMIVHKGKLFLTTFGDYLYVSSDNGQSWNQITAGLTTSEIYCIAAEGNNIVIGTDNGVFKSTNGGNSFTAAGLSGEFITTIATSGNYLFAYTSSGIKQSSNGGSTWISFEPQIPYSDITEFLVSGNKVFAATSGELISSNLTSPTWSVVSTGQNISFIFSLCKQGTDLYIAGNRGVYRSADNGVTWMDINNGNTVNNIGALTTAGNDTLYSGASIYGVSRNTSGNWIFSGLALLNITDMLTRGSEIFATTELGINRSTNAGNSWQLANNTGPNPLTAYCAGVDVKDSLLIGAALQFGILRSGDSGQTWSTQNNGMANALASCVTICPNNILTGTYNDGIFISTDGGFNWNQTTISGEFINDIASLGNNVIAAGANGVFYSADQGQTWSQVSNTYFEKLTTNNNFVIASGPDYIHISRDSGQTFTDIIMAPSGVTIAGITASATDLYIGTYRDGVWKRSISEILGVGEFIASKPGARIIPNLFKGSTNLISDPVLAGPNSRLFITDAKGALVKVIPASQQEIIVNCDNMQSGLYHYKVINGDLQSATGKFILMK